MDRAGEEIRLVIEALRRCLRDEAPPPPVERRLRQAIALLEAASDTVDEIRILAASWSPACPEPHPAHPRPGP